MKDPIGRKEDWVWLQRGTTVTRQFDRARKYDELRMRALVFPILAEGGMLKDHVYDAVTELENLHLSRVIYTPKIAEVLENLGWKTKEAAEKDLDEKREFYDALLKGGTLQ